MKKIDELFKRKGMAEFEEEMRRVVWHILIPYHVSRDRIYCCMVLYAIALTKHLIGCYCRSKIQNQW